MKSEIKHKIATVTPGSIAEQLELCPGDYLLGIDGEEIEDVLDYRLKINVPRMTMLIEKANGDVWELDIENDYEDPGLEFEQGLMSDYRSCRNQCIFCFIDQLPPGMRDTVYFKDDDARLSFLQGNYITLTNMTERDIQRIIRYRLEPVNISVHTTDPSLRCQMMHNRFAGESLRYLRLLFEAGIEMNGQIVLCPGWNDGEQLRRTLSDLLEYAPVMQSVSIVPVGLTDHRDGLTPLTPVDRKTAEETLAIIEECQKKSLLRYHMHFAHASDEFYLLADRELPPEHCYDSYPQLENGVGMLRLLTEEVRDAFNELPKAIPSDPVSLATGVLAAPYLKKMLKDLPRPLRIYPIENRFFGKRITVSGLVTGKDLLEQLQGKDLGKKLLLPINMFRCEEEVFLDDETRSSLEEKLGVQIEIVDTSGYHLVQALLS